MSKTSAGRATKKTIDSRAKFRELLTEQLTGAINRRGFVDRLFALLDQIEDPVQEFKCSVDLLTFVCPRLGAVKIEAEEASTPVTQIKFVEVSPKAGESQPQTGT